MKPFYHSKANDFILYEGDSRSVVKEAVSRPVEMVFADPPYFLSNGGFSVQAGRPVSVNKGDWDRSGGLASDTEFNYEWIKTCREVMSEAATIWVCGTFHNIFSVATVLSELDFKILNAVTWQKTNPPPNLSCRFFTHSTEIVLWARKQKKVAHTFNYDLMRKLAGDRQMTDVWKMPAIAPWEKTAGKHPVQKPLALVVRAILAASKMGDVILDPFAGSSTTGVAANLSGRKFIGVERERKFLELSALRRNEFDVRKEEWSNKIPDLRGPFGGIDTGKENSMLCAR